MTLAESDVQSAQVMPGASVPSAFDPVRMSCSTGAGEPVHWPLMRCPRSSTNSAASPVRAVQLGHVVRDEREVGVVPGPAADPVARVRRLIAVGRVALDAEIGAPGALAVTRRVASRWQVASAPARPPRLPVTLVALVTKKLVVLPVGWWVRYRFHTRRR